MSNIDIQKLIDLLDTDGINSKEIVSDMLKEALKKKK